MSRLPFRVHRARRSSAGAYFIEGLEPRTLLNAQPLGPEFLVNSEVQFRLIELTR